MASKAITNPQAASSPKQENQIAENLPRRSYFKVLDILRGFSALTVVIYHCIEHYKWDSFPRDWPLVWFRYGWMGVDIFFVLSGLVIGLSAFSKLNSQARERGFVRSFMAKRLLRIAPLHYLTLIAVVVIVSPRTWSIDLAKDVGAHLLFIHNLFPEFHGSINASNWSLGVELQFYILVALLARWLFQIRWHTLILLAILISWSWRLICLSIYGGSNGTSFDGFKLFFSTTQLAGLLDEFAMGLILAKLCLSPAWPRITSLKIWRKLIILTGSILLLSATLLGYQRHATYWNYPFMVIAFKTLLGLSFAGIIFSLIIIYPGKSLPRATAPLAYLGIISYGIYLWHLPVLTLIGAHFSGNPFKATTVVIAITLILSTTSWHFFEKPILSRPWKKAQLQSS